MSFALSANLDSVECSLCKKKNHELEDCRIFLLKKSMLERKAFVKEKKLCYGCLGSGHISRKCRARKKCKTCSRLHPTCLHGDKKSSEVPSQQDTGQPKENQPSVNSYSMMGVSNMNQAGWCSMSSMILPVYLSHADQPDSEKLVYALLDSQSDTSFILDKTCDSLGISGVEVNLLLSTMYAEKKVVKSNKIKGLSVRAFNKSLRLPLPVTYTRQIMPANRSHIPTPEKAKQISYLEPIARELMPLQDCEVGLLIGYNCAHALLPRDVIAPEKNGPFAQKTDLGWGIVGMMDSSRDEQMELDSVGVSHRVLVVELNLSLIENVNSDSKTDHVLVSFKNKVKEIISPVEITRMMELDFIEHKHSGTAYSVEDKQFLDKVQSEIKKVEGQYEMPLPLKHSDINLPNNKVLARRRLDALRRRLEKDEK